MADKKTKYTLTAAIGGLQRGESVTLTEKQAASPLYASRIAVPVSGDKPDDGKAAASKLVSDAKAEAEKIVADAQAEADKLLADAKEAAEKLVTATK